MMETEEEEEESAYVFEGEGEGEAIMESQEEEEEESEEEDEDEEEAEQLDEEMRPPVLTSWMGTDGIRVHGLICIDDGIIRLKNRCQLDDCSICLKPSTTHGKHQLCCLPCGHMFGLSCIKRWLLQSSSVGKCPQCNTLCSFEDAKLLYPTRLCVTAHQKASSAAFFPFTQQGFLEFKNYEYSRMLDAELLRSADITHSNILVTKHNDLAYRASRLARQRRNLLARAEELEERAESLGLPDALRRRASLLESRVEALRRRTDALKWLVGALTRRSDALEQRSNAFESRMRFYFQMYKEHHQRDEEIANAKHAFESEKKLAEKAAAANPKNIGEKVAEKKLKDKENKDEKKMHASGTIDVPEEEMVPEEPQEEKVEVKEKPTTKTTERVRVRSRSNTGKGPDSISKVIFERKKSNSYLYCYAAGAAALLAVGYTLYA